MTLQYRIRKKHKDGTMQRLHHDIIQACSLLFSPDTELSLDYVSSIDVATLKAAYRNKVFENHPDRARLLETSEQVLSERFRQIDDAYKKLYTYISDRAIKIIPARKETTRDWRPKKQTRKNTGEFHESWNRHLPGSELLFGQFLFYSHIISINTLLDAILWQRQQRPSFGELAAASGLLSPEDTNTIIRMRRHGEKFGECALRLGLINSFQFRHIIGKQQSIQEKIGAYFIEKKIVSHKELEALLKRNRAHNKIIRQKRAAV